MFTYYVVWGSEVSGLHSNLLYKTPNSVSVSIVSVCDRPTPPRHGVAFVSIPIASLVPIQPVPSTLLSPLGFLVNVH